MSHQVPLGDVAGLRLNLRDGGDWPQDLAFVPVSTTELHLAARSFPLAVRQGEGAPRLGLLVGADTLVSPLRTTTGAWRGGYQPIGLRTLPLVAISDTNDALADLVIDSDTPSLSADAGVPIADTAGRPSPAIVELHRLAVLLTRSAIAFAPALDHLLIAGLLAPLSASSSDTAGDPQYLVIDPAAFERLDGAALGAMARHSYLSVDLAVAGMFSLQALHPERRPQTTHGTVATPSMTPIAMLADIPFDELEFALDDGELIPFGGFVERATASGPDA